MHLHIVALDRPFPPHYGGIMDIFYKIETLLKQSKALKVYAFVKPRLLKNPYDNHFPPQWQGLNYHEYPRKEGITRAVKKLPYLLQSRQSEALYQLLVQDDAPILLEGLHCTQLLPRLRKQNPKRSIWVRVHNIESQYYQELAQSETNIVRKAFFWNEYRKLKRYEIAYLSYASGLACISIDDTQYLQNQLPSTMPIVWIPAFIPKPSTNDENINQQKLPTSILFHGNFEVRENQLAALKIISWLPKLKGDHIHIQFAGKGLDNWMQKIAQIAKISPHIHLQLLNNPINMEAIIQQAGCVLLPISQKSGVKLKLLTTLAHHTAVLTSREGALGAGLNDELETCGAICDKETEWISKINHFLNPDNNPEIPPPNYQKVFHRCDEIYNNSTNANELWNFITKN